MPAFKARPICRRCTICCPAICRSRLPTRTHETLDGYCEYEGLPTGYWVNFRKFTVSLLKAWYGEEAHPENDFRFGWLPRIDDDYSMVPYFDKMAKGEVEGYLRLRAEPGCGNLQRQARPAGTAQFEMARGRRLV